MTVTLKIRIINLSTEFRADTFIFLCPLKPAGTVSAGAFQSFFYCRNQFFIFVQPYSHLITSFLVLVSL